MNQQPDSVQIVLTCFQVAGFSANSSHLFPGCLWYSFSIFLRVASLYFPFLSASGTWVLHVLRMGRRTMGERSFQFVGPVICNSLPLSVTVFSFPPHSLALSQNWKPTSSAHWSVVTSIFHQPITSNACIFVVCVCVCEGVQLCEGVPTCTYVCVCVFVNVTCSSVGLCKHLRFLRATRKLEKNYICVDMDLLVCPLVLLSGY